MEIFDAVLCFSRKNEKKHILNVDRRTAKRGRVIRAIIIVIGGGEIVHIVRIRETGEWHSIECQSAFLTQQSSQGYNFLNIHDCTLLNLLRLIVPSHSKRQLSLLSQKHL
jgi:hypothetical protein